jgi:hypothetical protein
MGTQVLDRRGKPLIGLKRRRGYNSRPLQPLKAVWESDRRFLDACLRALVQPSKRQWKKWLCKRGLAWKAHQEAVLAGLCREKQGNG